jgi:hypothetical protein
LLRIQQKQQEDDAAEKAASDLRGQLLRKKQKQEEDDEAQAALKAAAVVAQPSNEEAIAASKLRKEALLRQQAGLSRRLLERQQQAKEKHNAHHAHAHTGGARHPGASGARTTSRNPNASGARTPSKVPDRLRVDATLGHPPPEAVTHDVHAILGHATPVGGRSLPYLRPQHGDWEIVGDEEAALFIEPERQRQDPPVLPPVTDRDHQRPVSAAQFLFV